MHRRVFGAERVNDDPISHGAGIQNNADTFRPSSSSSSNQHPVMIDVDLAHVGEYDTALLGLLLHQPAHVLPLVELAARDALRTLLYDTHSSQQQQQHDTRMDDDDDAEQQNLDHDGNAQPPSGTTTTNAVDDMMAAVGGIQILLKGNMALTPLRSIKSEHMHRLLKCPGIVISTSPIKSRAIQLIVRCSRCLHTQTMAPAADAGPFSAIVLPTRCAGPDPATCGTFPYGVVPDESQFWDRQTLKLQEAPETVPTGEMPRSVLLTVERALIDQAPPGTRVTVLCIPTLFSTGGNNNKGASAAVKSVYLRVVGMIKDDNAHDRDLFTPAEEEAFVTLSRRSDVYDILSRSVAPSISGSYTVDIKKALICLLLGGSRKRLPDGVRLRGDINVLLLGDPSTAKSQFLKFISRVAPIGIYTSGKGSSAAGLTASVVRDARGEFYLEGGAMVLADGGVVCIDEFDKMRPADRVAIHEAMEQQTISIAKAGITTVLNSRSSVLAAANPVFGRYDDFKSASENIDLMTTILSRFDLIFLVRDVRDEERDRLICRHVMGVHIGSNNNAANQNSMRHHGLTTSTNWRGHGAAGMGGGNDEDGQAGNHNMGDAMGMEG
jgi:DNA replication licensing factor MCM5